MSPLAWSLETKIAQELRHELRRQKCHVAKGSPIHVMILSSFTLKLEISILSCLSASYLPTLLKGSVA